LHPMITLYVAGIAHTDPLGPARLRKWLQSFRNTLPSEPSFVAVEWDERMFNLVKTQRDRFLRLASERWPTSPPEVVRFLVDAVAYDGDTHQATFPTVPTLWLDQGREADHSEIAGFAELRLKFYEAITSDAAQLSILDLDQMSKAAWARIQPRPDGPNARPDIFARRLFPELQGNQPAWGIAIMGANHVSESAGSAVDLLVHNGVDCGVTVLNPRFGSA